MAIAEAINSLFNFTTLRYVTLQITEIIILSAAISYLVYLIITRSNIKFSPKFFILILILPLIITLPENTIIFFADYTYAPFLLSIICSIALLYLYEKSGIILAIIIGILLGIIIFVRVSAILMLLAPLCLFINFYKDNKLTKLIGILSPHFFNYAKILILAHIALNTALKNHLACYQIL